MPGDLGDGAAQAREVLAQLDRLEAVPPGQVEQRPGEAAFGEGEERGLISRRQGAGQAENLALGAADERGGHQLYDAHALVLGRLILGREADVLTCRPPRRAAWPRAGRRRSGAVAMPTTGRTGTGGNAPRATSPNSLAYKLS